MKTIFIKQPYAFEWDKGNWDKNFVKHKITNQEIEEVFFDDNKLLLEDVLHSSTETRFILIGKTSHRKLLFIVFTIRNQKVRVVSARPLHKKEITIFKLDSNE